MTEHRSEVAAFLSRVANDEAFRDLLERDPDAALGQFDLPEEVQALALSQDASALALLSWEHLSGGLPQRPPERPRADLGDLGLGTALPPAELVLRLVPTTLPSGDLGHAASLHPLPAPGQPLLGLGPEDPAGALFRIRISPLATPHPDGLVQLSYTGAITPLLGEGDPTLVPDTGVPTNPWDHRDDDAARAAAARVLAAPPEARYRALVELIGAITGTSVPG